MVTMQYFLESLTGKPLIQSLENYLEEKFESFPAVHNSYITAIAQLRRELGTSMSPSVDDVVAAVDRQTTSNLLFSGALGIKANLDNFINPLARNFLDVDFGIYLREETAHRLPEYTHAQSVLDQFYTSLSTNQKALYEDVVAYICYLETIAPKLAHYYGYLLGNELFPRIIPGYHMDMPLTAHYRMMLDRWFCM